MKNIKDVVSKYLDDEVFCYGDYICKVEPNIKEKKGKLILVTSCNPTMYGEGKTTITIGLNDALNKIGKKSVCVLREPSLGPVFGSKGGAIGGGKLMLIPDSINLHFTGDMHAITSANNLICAVIDNHIYQGNELNIDINRISFNRCIDMNDRALRNIKIDIGNGIIRNESFNITAASEIMAILCLSESFLEMYEKIGNINFGYDLNGKMLFVKDLNCVDAVCILLKDAFKPNIVQSLEGNMAIVHGGPFANIAHGCNSIVATKYALGISDYVITEAGFGSDLGGVKFFDIKCRHDLKPNLVIINSTIRSLKHHGNGSLKDGVCNLDFHISNCLKFTNNIMIVLNKFDDDSDLDIDFLSKHVEEMNIPFSISDGYNNGSSGMKDFADEVINLVNNDSKLNFMYELDDSLINKINIMCKNVYGCENINISDEVMKKINELDSFKLPICISKTPFSITDNSKILGCPTNYDFTIKDVKLCSGAGFIVIYLGNVLTMPGLTKNSKLFGMKV